MASKKIELPIILVGTKANVYQAVAELMSNIEFDNLNVKVILPNKKEN